MIAGNLNINIVNNPRDLVAIWPKVRAGINSIKHRNEGYIYMPEDVYYEVKCGRATLITAYNLEGDYEGFIITKEHPFPDGPGVFFWISHHEGKQKNFTTDLFTGLRMIYKPLGVVRFSTSASRKGWDRVIQEFGCVKVGSTNYYEGV